MASSGGLTSFSFNSNTLSVIAGNTGSLTLTLDSYDLSAEVDRTTITFTSSDTSTTTVAPGTATIEVATHSYSITVTGVSAGSATITATCTDSQGVTWTSTATITVTNATQVIVAEQSLQDIADSIRGKLGVATTYKPADMASAIASIPSGGGNPNITSGQLILPSGWSSGTDLTIQHGLPWEPTLFFLYYNCFLFGGVRLFLYHNHVLGDMESGYQRAALNFNGAPTSITNGNSLTSGVNYVTSNMTEIKISGSLASVIGSNYINNYKAYWWAMYDANGNDFSAI